VDVGDIFGLSAFRTGTNRCTFAHCPNTIPSPETLILSAQLEQRISPTTLEIATLFTFQLFFLAIIVRVAFRVASTLTTKNFAESLCVRLIIYIVLDLSRNDILTHPTKRRTFVARVDDLARVTRLLSTRYASRNEINQKWIKHHFSQLENEVYSKEPAGPLPRPSRRWMI
jgi:hypothetical protein